MLAIRRTAQTLLVLSLAAAPASALDILPSLGGGEIGQWSDLEPVVLEFSDHDWTLFLRDDTRELLPPVLGAADAPAGEPVGLLTQVWEQP